MQYINSFLIFSDVDDSVRAAFVNPYLLHTCTDYRHRLPVKRRKAMLDAIKLKTCIPTGKYREST